MTRFLSPKDHAEVWDVDASTMTLSDTIGIPKFGGEDNRDGTAAPAGWPTT